MTRGRTVMATSSAITSHTCHRVSAYLTRLRTRASAHTSGSAPNGLVRLLRSPKSLCCREQDAAMQGRDGRPGSSLYSNPTHARIHTHSCTYTHTDLALLCTPIGRALQSQRYVAILP